MKIMSKLLLPTFCGMALFASVANAAGTDIPVSNMPISVFADSMLHSSAEGHSLSEVKETLKLGTKASASENKSKFMAAFDPSFKFGGYVVGKATVTDQSDKTHSGFDLRLIRLYMNGYAFKDFFYRIQFEASGQPKQDNGPRVLDAFVEWQHWKELRVKLGQFKRSFTFENPMSPWEIGWGVFSQLSNKLAGISVDRNGAHKSGGRDVGLQIQGDLLAAKDGRHWFHYQVGFFNGQGINHSDKDNFKDIIGGLWVNPCKNLRIGWFGWSGKYTNENYKAIDPLSLKRVKRVRWSAGIDYEHDWVVRGEYGHSVGGVVTNSLASDRADSWYATVGAPVTKNLKLYCRWDCYREAKQWNNLVANYGLAANWRLAKNFMLQLNYYLTNNRTIRDKYYNTAELQVYARF